jgi:hypothetical protein
MSKHPALWQSADPMKAYKALVPLGTAEGDVTAAGYVSCASVSALPSRQSTVRSCGPA